MPSLLKKTTKAVKNPRKIVNYYLWKKGELSEKFLDKNYSWSKKQYKGNIKRRKYKNYKEYVKHQKAKLAKVKNTWLPEYDAKYHTALRQRLKKQALVKPGMNVLCLAARIGTEVKSFLDLGTFAIGIDLNPGKQNKYVVHGDFHDIQYPENSVDVIFSNSFDHAFDFDKLIEEIKRVLKHKGILILELAKGEDEGEEVGNYESVAWGKIDDVLKLFTKAGFKVMKRDNFSYPDDGQHISLMLQKKKSKK